MALVTCAAFLSLGYTLGPSTPIRHVPRAQMNVVMEEYRLNNYILSGPMKPMGNQVLIKLRKAQDQTAGGLFVAGAEAEKPKEGLVVAAGPGKTDPVTGKLLANPVNEGDLVLLADFTGENVDYNREKHLFVDADYLLGRFENKETTVAAFSPLGDRVLVEIAAAEQETATGIAIATGDDEEEDNSGVVAAVGAGRYNQNGELCPVSVSAGENVMYARRSGIDATLEGKKFKVVSERDCLAKW